MKGLLGADRLIACLPGELHLKFSNVLRTFRPVGVYQGDKEKSTGSPALLFVETRRTWRRLKERSLLQTVY